MKKNIEIAVSIVLSDVFQKLQAIQQSPGAPTVNTQVY
jgi:hypothetical protein